MCKYKSLSELKKMTVGEIVTYVKDLGKNDKGAICNLPEFQNWCFEISELDEFEDIASKLGWEI